MTKLEDALREEIEEVLKEKVSEQDGESVYDCLSDNIQMSIYSHQEGFIGFSELKTSLDVLLSVFYKSFPNASEDIYKAIEDLAIKYANNPGTVIYFQLVNARNNLIKKRITKLSNLKQN